MTTGCTVPVRAADGDPASYDSAGTPIAPEFSAEAIEIHVIDLGPGAGTSGGRVVAQGTAGELARSPQSVTGRFLAKPLAHPLVPKRAVRASDPALVIQNATLHNLQGVEAQVPLGRLIAITGVSGSGKSTLARDVLHDNLKRALSASNGSGKDRPTFAGCRDMNLPTGGQHK